MDVLVPVCGGWGVPIEDPDRISYSIQGNISFRAPVVPSSPLSPSVSASKPQSTLPVLASSRKLGRGGSGGGVCAEGGPHRSQGRVGGVGAHVCPKPEQCACCQGLQDPCVGKGIKPFPSFH